MGEKKRRSHGHRVWLTGSLGTLLLAALLVAVFTTPSASAFEQVGIFAGSTTPIEEGEEFPEEVQLGGVSGMAVNYTGAGGVPAGTIYAATRWEGELRIARYNPDRSFSEAWLVRTKAEEEASEGNGEAPYERCGPDGDPAFEHCAPNEETPNAGGLDVDVDQTTGNVYAFDAYSFNPTSEVGLPNVTEYTADGSEAITRFAETAPPTDEILDSPEKIHKSPYTGAIAVNGAGEVFIADVRNTGNFYRRLAVFKPQSPGDYTHYVYAGQANDVGAGDNTQSTFVYPLHPVVDAAGFVYVSNEEKVVKYDPAHPADPPVCEFRFKKGGIESIAVNPLTGEAFFYTYKGGQVHRLSACKEGKFTELEAFARAPSRELKALTYDPVRSFSPGRPAGVLYGGAPEADLDGLSGLGYVFAPSNEIPPEVISEAVTGVTQTSARLEGTLDPKGNPTRYVFQYISDAAYQANEPSERFAGATEAPAGGVLVEGSKALAAAFSVEGLQPGARYHVRLVASSHCSPGEAEKECTAQGPGRSFRTFSSQVTGLPDHRAYELVSPTEKSGGQVFPLNPEVSSCLIKECKPGSPNNHFPMLSAPDGDAVAYEGNGFSFDEGALIENQYLARRTDTGWQSANLTPPLLASKGGAGYKAFSTDLGEAVLEQEGGEGLDLTPADPPGFYNLYAQPSAEPLSLAPLLTEAPPNRVPGHSNSNRLQLSYAGASSDLSRIFFAANDALTPEAEGGPEAKTNLYESSGGQLHLVNLAPGNASTLPGAVFGSGQLLQRGNGNLPENFVFHAISEDGSRAFWTSEEDGHLYVREGGQTTLVPDPNSCAASLEVSERTCFIAAAADGSRVLLSDGLLFDVTDLAAPPLDLTGGKGGFLGLAGQSEDLSRAYFVDTAVLTGEEENSHGDKAEAGKPNLYAWHEGATSFIATLPSSSQDDWKLAPAHRTATASPDGRWFAFVSEAPLTGFDNTGPCEFEAAQERYLPAPCTEAFLYEADSGALRCPSCNPTDTGPHGPARLPMLGGGANSVVLPLPRYLSDSGRFFFDTQDALSPFDTNGRVEDVYEFEPNGIGDCAGAGGCVRMISEGSSGFDSNFLAADPSGRNVFFTSRDTLVRQDEDALIDLYDAREGGGFPPEAPSGECQGEACLPSVSPPDDPTPASAGLDGSGNVPQAKSRRCPKGRHVVKRKGKSRCMKKKRHAKRRHRHHRIAHSHRGGAK